MGPCAPIPTFVRRTRRGTFGRPRGSALVYLSAVMVALTAFVSLAVDLSHVYVVRAELQLAADSASRYGVTALGTGVAAAQAAAVDAADDNKADGTPVVLDTANDIEFCNWNKATRTYTVLTGASRSSANALRVTARRTAANGGAVQLMFARVLGKTSQNVQASSITYIERRVPSGIIGLNGVTFKNNTFVGSYNSSTNTGPSQSTAGSGATVGSNGAITGGTNNNISGGVALGPSAPNVAGVSASGSTTRLSSAIEAPADPAWSPAANPNGVAQNYSVNGNITLPGGTYWFTSLTVRGSLRFSGPATLYVNGPIMVSGSLCAYNLVPGNLKIYQLGNNDFGDDDINGGDIVADVIAPRADFLARNNLTFRGRLLVRTIVLQNNADLYYDVALGSSMVGGVVVATVR